MDKIHNHEVAGSIPAPATIKEISKLRHGSLLIFVCIPLELFHGEGEVGVGEGLVFEGEVPPFAVEGLESVTEHRLAQDHTVGKLLWGNAAACGTLAVVARIFTRLGIAAEVRMALWTEPVESTAHIEFLLRSHIEEGEIDGGAACVAAFLIDVFLFEEYAFVKIGIEVCLHQRVRDVFRPAHKVVYTHLRTVGVIDLQPIALRLHIVADGTEGLGCLFRQQGGGLQITVHARAHEIIGAVIADLEDSVWHHIGDVCKLAAVISGRHCGLFLVVGTTVGRHYAADDEDNGNHT